MWHEPEQPPMGFTLIEPLVFAEGDTSNTATVPRISKLFCNEHVMFSDGGQFLIGRSNAQVTTFIRRQKYRLEETWRYPWQKYLPRWMRGQKVSKKIPTYPALVIPAGCVGVVLSRSFAEGSSQPIEGRR